jgi:hypothetical protein
VVAAMLSHKSEIRLRQRIPANQLSGVIRESQQMHSLGRGEDFAAGHRFAVYKNDAFQDTITCLRMKLSVLQEL